MVIARHVHVAIIHWECLTQIVDHYFSANASTQVI